MSVVTPYLNKLKSIEGKIPDLAKQALKENYSEIVMLVKAEQLGQGLNSLGRPLAWEDNGQSGNGAYAPGTQDKADREGVSVPKTVGTPYNFNWTGGTLDNMAMKNTGVDTFEIFTTDSKKAYLEGIYGEIFQLTPKHNEYVNQEIILPFLYRFVLNNFMKV